ncbi:MAG: hypothetical protein EXR72_08710 [Myxococcales bacterium]|nr:hypothetical protein [Myxococcales bacterium]
MLHRNTVRDLGFASVFAAGLAACTGDGYRGYNPLIMTDADGGVIIPGGGGPSADMTAPPDLAKAAYPAGPYGNKVDQTLANQHFEGYRLAPGHTDSAEETWEEDISFGDFAANPACKCLLITYGAGWCGACKQEQPKLVAEIEEDSSFCVLGILQEGNSMSPATKADADNWTRAYKQNFPVVLGTSQSKNLWNGHAKGSPPSIGLPFNMVVHPRSMKVLQVIQGYDPNIKKVAMAACAGG